MCIRVKLSNMYMEKYMFGEESKRWKEVIINCGKVWIEEMEK